MNLSPFLVAKDITCLHMLLKQVIDMHVLLRVANLNTR